MYGLKPVPFKEYAHFLDLDLAPKSFATLSYLAGWVAWGLSFKA